MSRRGQSNYYRRLRLERSEDRCLLSAAPFATPDLMTGDVTADDTATYLPIANSGWVLIDTDSRLPSFDFSTGGASSVSTREAPEVSTSYPTTLGTLNFTAESFRDDAAALRLSLDHATDEAGLTFSWLNYQQGQVATPVWRAEIADRGLTINADFVDALVAGLPDQGVDTRGESSPLADFLQRWLSENTSYLGGAQPNAGGWIDGEAGTGTSDQETSTGWDLGSWAESETSTGPATPTLDDAFARGDDGYGTDPSTTFSQGDDDRSGSHLLAKLREWLRDGSPRADGDGLDGESLRRRPSAIPLQRVTESPAPAAGEEAPGAGMIDLTALLLPTSAGDEAPSVLLAAASQAGDESTAVSARDAALAVESWVRALPVPAEPVDAVEGVAPFTEGPAVGVRTEVPSRQDAPRPQAAKDHVSRLRGDSGESSGGFQAFVQRPQTPAVRIDEQRADDAPGYVAAWLTTLLGGATVWANRWGGRYRASDCIETPLGKRRGLGNRHGSAQNG